MKKHAYSNCIRIHQKNGKKVNQGQTVHQSKIRSKRKLKITSSNIIISNDRSWGHITKFLKNSAIAILSLDQTEKNTKKLNNFQRNKITSGS